MAAKESKTGAETEERKLTAIIMAGGKGTRMASPLPKVLHPVAGRPMIERVIRSCQAAGVRDIRVVVGHGQNLVRQVVEPLGVHCYLQERQLGTGDAVRAAQPETVTGDVLILSGDVPLVNTDDLRSFISEFREQKAALAVVTAELKKPGDLGRIIRSGGNLHSIVEARDATIETLKIREINTGIYVAKAEILSEYLPLIKNENSKGEFYLTDIVSLCIENQEKTIPIKGKPHVSIGVNCQVDLAKATRAVFRRKIKTLMDSGVLVIDPRSTYIEDEVIIGPASVIYPNVYLRGYTKLGNFCVVEPNCYIHNTEIGDSVQIRAGSYLESSKIYNKATLGPYARLRPETEIGEEAHVGNFVEMKKVRFGKKSKAGHLTYLGDADVGEETNIGCGTITCNYAADKKKYKTTIGSRVFVGSDSQFVAPVVIGDDSYIGSGSTITKDVPAKSLAVARGRQFVKENWAPKKD
ncbi:MAG: bifunctional UDP-N-acetylglucosamine diphosphorylase/glucosamine-1-phosphate N-acetyltransferase GlmU, partial [Pseudobdellovibrionaceae bacterium]